MRTSFCVLFSPSYFYLTISISLSLSSLVFADPSPDANEEDLFNDTGSVFEPEEDGSDIDIDFDSDVEDQYENNSAIMPTKTRSTAAAKKSPARPSTSKKAADGLAKSLGNMTLKNNSSSFSFEQKSSWVQKDFTKNKKDWAEIEFLVMPLDLDHFRINLTEDGLNCSLHVATPEWFGETKRLKKAMDDKWHENDPRVVAHDDTVQEIRKTNKAKDKKFWGGEPQVVPLPFKCEGRVVKAWNFHPIGDVGGQTQYALIISLFFKKAIKRVEKEKAGRISILTQLSEDSEDDDIDDDGNGANNEEMNENEAMNQNGAN